jgi:hypothetical protein
MSAPANAQAPSAVVLIRPSRFAPNPATATDNAFQGTDSERSPATLAADAYTEATNVAAALREHGIAVHLFEDEDGARPDSVFPNNWFSTHPGGRIAVFPMFSPSRRTERRADIIETVKATYRVQDVVDYSGLEHDGIFLEGTGAMVLDHVDRVAYTARSNRANPHALQRFCANFGYEPFVFDAAEHNGIPIYHTNVLMCIATDVALVGLDLITPSSRRDALAERLSSTGRTVIALDGHQIADFAGNAIELRGRSGRLLATSARAHRSLTDAQREEIERSCPILPLDVPTIELAGGSIRCMIAGIHLSPRPIAPAGKSTLMKPASGAVLPDSGSVMIDGHALPRGETRPLRLPPPALCDSGHV